MNSRLLCIAIAATLALSACQKSDKAPASSPAPRADNENWIESVNMGKGFSQQFPNNGNALIKVTGAESQTVELRQSKGSAVYCYKSPKDGHLVVYGLLPSKQGEPTKSILSVSLGQSQISSQITFPDFSTEAEDIPTIFISLPGSGETYSVVDNSCTANFRSEKGLIRGNFNCRLQGISSQAAMKKAIQASVRFTCGDEEPRF